MIITYYTTITYIHIHIPRYTRHMHIAHARHRRAHAASPLPRRDREELTCVCWRLFVFFALSIAGSAAATAAEKNAKKRTYVLLRFFVFF